MRDREGERELEQSVNLFIKHVLTQSHKVDINKKFATVRKRTAMKSGKVLIRVKLKDN